MHPTTMGLLVGDNNTYESISILEEMKEISNRYKFLKIWMWRVYW